MTNIRRIDYQKASMKLPNFEIVDLQLFFSSRPKKLLEKDYRLNFWSIIYIIEGQGSHSVDFKTYDYNAGDIIFVQKNQVHHFTINYDAKGYIMHINEPFLLMNDTNGNNAFLEFIDQIYDSPIVSVDNTVDSTNRKLIEIMYSEYNRNIEGSNDRFVKALFDSFILSIFQHYTYRNRRFKTNEYSRFMQFKELVEEHFDEHRNLDEYANSMGVSKKTINQAVRAVVDLSAKEFINNRLYLEIKRCLSQGELYNYEIADLLGFDEPANMTKFFKKHEGISPKEFRNGLNMD